MAVLLRHVLLFAACDACAAWATMRPAMSWRAASELCVRRRPVLMADDDAPPPFSFASDAEKAAPEPESPPPFSFLRREEKPKNAVAIQREKDKKFLAQQREFQRSKRDTSYQAGLEEFSLGSAASDVSDAMERASVPPVALLFGVLSISAVFWVVTTLLFS